MALVLAGAEGVLGHGRARPVGLGQGDRGRDVRQVRQPLGVVAQEPPAVAVVFLGIQAEVAATGRPVRAQIAWTETDEGLWAANYGGYFGGALGVILVGVLGIALHRLKLANALKSALSAVTATVPVVIFGIFGPVHWDVVAVAAPASLIGGFLGARVATRIPSTPLRLLIVTFGVAVSVYLFLRG